MQFCHARCNCIDCANNLNKDDERRAAMYTIKERNPDAFKSKVVSSATASKDAADGQTNKGTPGASPLGGASGTPSSTVPAHVNGCHCKKSGCLKKYCECFSINVQCSEKCRCLDCKNISVEMRMKRIQAMESNLAAMHESGGGPVHLTSPATAAQTGYVL